jgi:hypothetical protein
VTHPPGDAAAGGRDDGHVDLDSLAELDEDLLPAERADEVTTHLAGCSTCQAQHGRIRATRALLSALPADPIPASVGDRIDAALTTTAGNVVPLTSQRRGWRAHPTAAGAGAAAAAIALIAAIVVGTTSHHGSSDRRGPQTASGPIDAGAEASRTFPISVSDRHYTQDNAAQLVGQLLSTSPGESTATDSGATPSPAARRVAPALRPLHDSNRALLNCVSILNAGGPSEFPVAVDFARFTDRASVGVNKPVVVIVLPSGDPTEVRVYFVGPGCTSGSDINLYRYQVVPRPS